MRRRPAPAAGDQDRRGQDAAPSTTLSQKIARQSGHGEDRRAEQRAEHAAELLHRADDAERGAAAVAAARGRRPGRASPAPARRRRRPAGPGRTTSTGSSTASAVTTEPTTNTARQPSRTRCRGSEVGEPADQRQHRDVAEQEARDDRGRPLQRLDAQPDPGHHVGQRQHDDVGVGRGERDRDRGGRRAAP